MSTTVALSFSPTNTSYATEESAAGGWIESANSRRVKADWVDLGSHLQDLCDALATSSPRAGQFDLSLKSEDDCLVRPHHVAAIALIVSEAVTNAIKHAHPAGVRGVIEVRCRHAVAAIVIDVVDDGVGLPEGFDPDLDGGHGFAVMRRLSEQLGAKIRFASTSLGLRVRLRAAGSQGADLGDDDAPGKELRYRDLLDALPTAIYTTDALGRITFYNQAAVTLWGRRPALGDLWCGSWRLYWPDGEPMEHGQCPMAVTIRENREVRGGEAIAERPDGTRAPFLAFPTPIRDASGVLIGAVNALVDISERKQAEDRQKLLAREVHHRTKNLLSVVYSIVARGMDGERTVADARETVLGRLRALAATYDNLITTSWAGVELGEIVRTELGPYPAQWEIDGPELVLNPNAAQNFTLAVHELATNAAKYGALSTPGGAVRVRWTVEEVDGASRFAFVWQERGGPVVSPRTHEGFGSMVLERVITHDFNAPPRIDFAPEGLTYALDVSLDSVIASERESDTHVLMSNPRQA